MNWTYQIVSIGFDWFEIQMEINKENQEKWNFLNKSENG